MIMKKMLILAGLALIGASGASAGFAKQWTVPWWTDANPHTDTDGNQWAVYQINATSDAATADWKAMTWQSGTWRGPQMVYTQPYYWSDHALTVAGFDQSAANPTGAYRNSGLSFTAGATGIYSWTGTLEFAWEQNNNSITVDFGKFNGTSFTSLYSTPLAPGASLNLANIPELQNLSLNAGETIGFSQIQPTWWTWGYTNVGTVVGIGLVPEPALASLLALGGLLLGARRARR